jgi:YD repeat-containing protein
VLRTELYALDGSDRQDRPYTVTESLSGVREESPPADRERARIFFPFGVATRTTQWERGIDPMTQLAFTTGHDEFGLPTGELAVAVPRGRDPWRPDPAATQPYLATFSTTEYARRDEPTHYVVDRVARTSSHEVRNDGRVSVLELREAVLSGDAALRVIGHSRTFYDGEEFFGLPLGQLGDHGVAVRTESLAFTDAFLDELYDPVDPLAVSPRPVYLDPGSVSWGAEYPEEFRALLPELAEYRHYTDADVPGSPGGYFVAAARHRYDVHDPDRVPRGLPLASLDPFGAETRISYDQHDLLPTRTTDPVGLVTEAVNDPRTLRPRDVTDANGNSSSVTYSPARFRGGRDRHEARRLGPAAAGRRPPRPVRVRDRPPQAAPHADVPALPDRRVRAAAVPRDRRADLRHHAGAVRP